MAKTNAEVAQLLSLTADLSDLEGSNPFRIRAYQAAARTIENLSDSIIARDERGEDLTKLSGIGKDLAAKIHEIAETGSFQKLEELRKRVPQGLIDMLHLPNLGARRVRMLRTELGVTTLSQLEKAAQENRIQELEGFGEKMEQKILAEIQRFQSEEKRYLYAEAEDVIQPLLTHLRKLSHIRSLDVAGSFRRSKETVGDIDLLVVSVKPEEVMDHFVSYDQVETVYGKGKTKSSVRLTYGIQIDLRVVPAESYGAALLYFTGSKAHNIALRSRAQERGWTINEYRLSDGKKSLAGKTEQEIYEALDLAFVPPVLREDRGEIQAAEDGTLPDLITQADITGDLHCHTNWSDGRHTIEEMVAASYKKGYAYIGITDHSQRLTVAHGLTPERLKQQIAEIDQLNKRSTIPILKGMEVDILEDGSLDMPDDILKELDFTVCSIHSKMNLPQEAQTKRVVTAMQNPLCAIIGHPTGRLIGKRPEMELDMEAVISAARDTGTILEINAQPDRLDLKDTYITYGMEQGVRFVVSTDSHAIRNLDFMRFGINQARRGWLSASHIINAQPYEAVRTSLSVKRR